MLILGVEGWQSSAAESAAAATVSAAVAAAAHQSAAAAAAAASSGAQAGDVILSAENLTQAAIILILDVVIICSNLLIIATLATGSGPLHTFLLSSFLSLFLNTNLRERARHDNPRRRLAQSQTALVRVHHRPPESHPRTAHREREGKVSIAFSHARVILLLLTPRPLLRRRRRRR